MRNDRTAARERVAALSQASGRAYLLALRVTGSPAVAEEAVQEAFTRLLERPPRDQGPEAALSYFLKAVRHFARDLDKSARHRRRREERHVAEQAMSPQTPEQLNARKEAAQAARTSLAELPVEEQEAICLCCEQGMTRRAAAEVLELPERTVSERVQRGLEKLRLRLAAQGFAAIALPTLDEGLRELGIPPIPGRLEISLQRLLTATRSSARLARRVTARLSASKPATGPGIIWAAAIFAALAGLFVLLFATPARPAPMPRAPAAAEPQPPTPAPAEESLYRRWNFERGPAEGFAIVRGVWNWDGGSDGLGAGMRADSAAWVLLPVKIPPRPFIIQVRYVDVATAPDKSVLTARWVRESRMPPARTWLFHLLGMESRNPQVLQIAFAGAYSQTNVQNRVGQVMEYREAYPGDQMLLVLQRMRIQEIEIRSLRSVELPALLREPGREIEKLKIEPIEAPEEALRTPL